MRVLTFPDTGAGIDNPSGRRHRERASTESGTQIRERLMPTDRSPKSWDSVLDGTPRVRSTATNVAVAKRTSDRAIADEIGVTHPTVAKARRSTGKDLPVVAKPSNRRSKSRPNMSCGGMGWWCLRKRRARRAEENGFQIRNPFYPPPIPATSSLTARGSSRQATQQ